MGAGLAGNTNAPLCFAAIGLEFVPAEWPINSEGVKGAKPKVLGGEAVRVSLPMHGGAPHRHRARDYSSSTLVLDEITWPRILVASESCSARVVDYIKAQWEWDRPTFR